MNYTLAKKLKDAGFPHTWCSEDDCSCLTNGVNSACFPTLEELIEACGSDFHTLHRISKPLPSGTIWKTGTLEIDSEKIIMHIPWSKIIIIYLMQ